MTKFEKIIIPFVVDNIVPIDLTQASGFIDSFTHDPDRPSGDFELFLVYNDTVRNEYVKMRSLRLEACKNLKRTYVKIVNNIPYYVYSFWIPSKFKKFYSDIIALSILQKAKLLQFWGPFDNMIDEALSGRGIYTNTSHNMPLADYPDEFDGITIKRKETASNEVASFFLIWYKMTSHNSVSIIFRSCVFRTSILGTGALRSIVFTRWFITLRIIFLICV